jgi:hypothetical protein
MPPGRGEGLVNIAEQVILSNLGQQLRPLQRHQGLGSHVAEQRSLLL